MNFRRPQQRAKQKEKTKPITSHFHSPSAPIRLATALAPLLARSACLWTAPRRAARLLPLLLLLTQPAAGQAQFTYTVSNGAVAITGYDRSGGAVIIPSTINGLPVTSIGSQAFVYVTGLTSVTIPNSVTSIGEYAFYGCTNLTDVTIPDRISSIEFQVFFGCSSLTSVTIPNSVTSIRANAFSRCTSLSSVTIGNSVTNIGSQAFSGCSSLRSITLPNSIISISDNAFYGCTSVTSVTIGNGLTSINGVPFFACSSLTNITVDALNPAFTSVAGVLFNKSQTTLIKCPEGKTGSYAIPNTVTSIGDYAFALSTRLTSVTIPNSVTNVGNEAFSTCASLMAITVNALNPAFSSVDGVLFNQSQTTLLQYPGAKGGGYTIPDSVTTIEDLAFWNSSLLTSVTIGNGVTTIGAFAGCGSLTNVTIGNSVTHIEGGEFSGCPSLSAITVNALNSAYSSVAGVLFEKSQSTLIRCPEGKTGSYTIPNSVTNIANRAFLFCSGLTDVTIPNSVIDIGDWAFSGCPSLTVYFQGNAPGFGSNVFGFLRSPTVYYWPGTMGWGATFAGRPTAQWLPEARTSDADFGVRTNQFGFNIHWASDKVVVVEASPDLSNPVWAPVSTNTLTGGSSYFSDPQWTNHPSRFYRLVSPAP